MLTEAMQQLEKARVQTSVGLYSTDSTKQRQPKANKACLKAGSCKQLRGRPLALSKKKVGRLGVYTYCLEFDKVLQADGLL